MKRTKQKPPKVVRLANGVAVQFPSSYTREMVTAHLAWLTQAKEPK